MRIVRQDNSRRFELRETDPRMPLPVVLGAVVVVALVASPWKGLWGIPMRGAGRDSLDLATSAVWFACGLLFLASLLGGYRLEQLRADSDSGRLEWRWSHLAGLFRWRGRMALDALDGFTLDAVPKPGAASSRLGLPLRLTLHRREGGRRRIDLRVEGVASAAAITEVALRLGAAAGMRFYRVAANEPPRLSVELRKAAATGFSTAPETEPGARRDAVSLAAATATAEERLPPFDAAAFQGSARVTVWRPGREVRIEKGWSVPVLLAPLLLCALLGPFCYFSLPSLQSMPALPRAAALALITACGLALALLGWAGVATGLPRRVDLDWATRQLRARGLLEQKTVPFSEIAAIELRRTTHRTHTSRGAGLERVSYRAGVWVRLRSAPPERDTLLLLETRFFRDDPGAPRFMALPLAHELAAALGVERRDTDPTPI